MHWRRKWQPTPVFLPGESQRQWAPVYGVAQSWTRLKLLSSSIAFPTCCCNVILLVGLGFPLGSDSKESACNAGDLGSIPGQDKGMAAHFSILAWRLPQTEQPGGPQSMGLKESTQLTPSVSLLSVLLTSCALQRTSLQGGFYIH